MPSMTEGNEPSAAERLFGDLSPTLVAYTDDVLFERGRGGDGRARRRRRGHIGDVARHRKDEFCQWDLRLYCPLCLALGTAALAARARPA